MTPYTKLFSTFQVHCAFHVTYFFQAYNKSELWGKLILHFAAYRIRLNFREFVQATLKWLNLFMKCQKSKISDASGQKFEFLSNL